MNPIGINILAQYVKNTTALMGFLKASNPAVIIVMDGNSLAQTIRRELPEITVIHRAYNPNDAKWHEVISPQEWLRLHKPFAANGVVVQCFNEPAPGDLNAFLTWLEQLVALCPNDVALAFPAFAVGNPNEQDILNGKHDRLLKLVCGTRHILMLHEYFKDKPINEAPYLCGRYSFWLDRADSLQLPHPKLVMGEHGRDIGGGKNDGWKGAGWSEAEYFSRIVEAQQYGSYSLYDIPVCLYCWGTGANNDWLSFDIQDATGLQGSIIQYGKDHPMTQPTQPPAEYPPGTLPINAVVNLRKGVNLRTSPDASSPANIITLLPFDEPVTVFEQPSVEGGDYTFIRCVTSQHESGWAAQKVGGVDTFVPAIGTTVDTNRVVIEKIPYSSEFGWANGWTALCGETSLYMLLEWNRLLKGVLLPPEITPLSIALYLGKGPKDFTNLTELKKAADAYGIETSLATTAMKMHVEDEIDAGRPFIALIDYSKLPTRWDKKFAGGHLLVVAGYSDQSVICHDPDSNGIGGAYPYISYPRADFAAAWGAMGNTALVLG